MHGARAGVAAAALSQVRAAIAVVAGWREHEACTELRTTSAVGVAPAPRAPLAEFAMLRTFLYMAIAALGERRARVSVAHRGGHDAAFTDACAWAA